MKEITFQGQKFLFLEQKIENINNLKLIPNFEEKLSSTQLFQNNHCQFLINGGFYDQEDQPLGWFFTQGKLFRKEIKSALLNGFFFYDQQKGIVINDVSSIGSVVWGLQTGPILIFEREPLIFKMAKDERARRMVAAIGQNDELFFLVIAGPDSLAGGPLLADLPFIVQGIGKSLKNDFKTAINLDGGTASVFINKEKIIKEYTWTGSFFCLTQD
jgi:exopolysaccharide biosynthesis protein